MLNFISTMFYVHSFVFDFIKHFEGEPIARQNESPMKKVRTKHKFKAYCGLNT